jgi:BirA family biotin operon repressor/biotin-[acetyl-CoA-carboxylase] ligase
MSQTDVTATWSDAADPQRRIGHAVEFHAEIGSTNDRARELLADGRHGVAVVADLQTEGRGRRGRAWASPAGVNLMCSVAIETHLAARDAGLLGGAVALAVVQATDRWAPLVVRWPNDLVTDDGLKVGGLLVETTVSGERLTSAVVGVGINVNWPRADMPAELRQGATSLMELAGGPVDRLELLGRVLERLDREIGDFEAGLTPVPRLRARSWLDGEQIEVDTGDEVVRGVGAGIAEDGSLLVDTEAGRIALAHGEVVRVQPAGPAP